MPSDWREDYNLARSHSVSQPERSQPLAQKTGGGHQLRGGSLAGVQTACQFRERLMHPQNAAARVNSRKGTLELLRGLSVKTPSPEAVHGHDVVRREVLDCRQRR